MNRQRNRQHGKGYYMDLNLQPIAGLPVYKGYNDFAPPIFMGELINTTQSGGKRNKLDKKIDNLKRYIATGGRHQLIKEVREDFKKY